MAGVREADTDTSIGEELGGGGGGDGDGDGVDPSDGVLANTIPFSLTRGGGVNSSLSTFIIVVALHFCRFPKLSSRFIPFACIIHLIIENVRSI